MRQQLIPALLKLSNKNKILSIEADFKTVEKKFLTTVTDKDLVKEYLKKFKSLRDQNRIPEGNPHIGNNKDIDVWGKRGFEAFKNFVDEISETKSKTKQKKSIHKEAQKIDGATLVAENDEWLVYFVFEYEAAKLLGSRNWCIVRDENTWDEYDRGDGEYVVSNFYFVLAKDRPEDEWHKIAIQVDSNHKIRIWDNLDNNRRDIDIYKSLGVPAFDIDYPTPICPVCGEKKDYCECCGRCGNSMDECTCCDICGSPDNENCGCCLECEKPDTECNCCPVCGDTDKDYCGCCQECKHSANHCICDKEDVKANFKIKADYKTVQKKFINQGIDEPIVKEYLDTFKKLRDKNRIQDTDKKDIDYWGKKSWDTFTSFIDDLEKSKSKTEEKKLTKLKGADLVAENGDWRVYHITTHEAAMVYGSGTKWCITQKDGIDWYDYSEDTEFIFLISKNRDKDDPFYKLALQYDLEDGEISYWDATDKYYGNGNYGKDAFDLVEFNKEMNIPLIKFGDIMPKERAEENIEAIYLGMVDNQSGERRIKLDINGKQEIYELTEDVMLPKNIEIGDWVYINLVKTSSNPKQPPQIIDITPQIDVWGNPDETTAQNKLDKPRAQVFVYETLLNNKLLAKVLKRPTDTVTDKLMEYKEISMEGKHGKNYHTIIPDVNDYVLGKRFYVTPEDLKILDKWESDYSRKKVRLVSEQVAWVYILKLNEMADKGHNYKIEADPNDFDLVELPEIKWVQPTDKELTNEIKSEFKIETLFICEMWPKDEHYRLALDDLKHIAKPENLDPKKLKGYHTYWKSYDELYRTVKSYGGPKDPESMIAAIKEGKPLPMPVVVRKRNGEMEVLGGATRTGIASLAGQHITGLVIDEKEANELMADRLEMEGEAEAKEEKSEDIFKAAREYVLHNGPKPTFTDTHEKFLFHLAVVRFDRIARLLGLAGHKGDKGDKL